MTVGGGCLAAAAAIVVSVASCTECPLFSPLCTELLNPSCFLESIGKEPCDEANLHGTMAVTTGKWYGSHIHMINLGAMLKLRGSGGKRELHQPLGFQLLAANDLAKLD